ncbi:hypothetical protein [Epilithonimonas sp.]|uniref:hypothetical protein n=1 Tax=Epilithonimonas sp. TaxID=2894511 RepID=UPI002FDDAD87
MNINEINKIAYSLIKLLEVKNIVKQKESIEQRKKYIGEQESVAEFNLKEGDFFIIYENDILNNNVAVSAIIKNTEVGLNRENYQILNKLVEELLINNSYINDNCDFEFVEKKLFKWIIEIYSKNKADFDFYDYLMLSIEKEKNDYFFYFKINDLIIEEAFSLGNCKFTSLDKNFFEARLEEMNQNEVNISIAEQKDFISLNKMFLNRVLIAVTFSAVHSKATIKAMNEVELSVNALKIFLTFESLTQTSLFNVDFKDMNNDCFEYFSYNKKGNFNTVIGSKKSTTQPTEVSLRYLKNLKLKGLEKISKFLKNKKSSELYLEIENLINEYGSINSTPDLRIRIVLLVSYFERIIIPKTNLKGKGQAFLKNNILPKLIANPDEEIANKINRIYRIRDKYLHNRIELPIDVDSFLVFNDIARIFLLKLVDLNNLNYETLDDVYAYFKIPTSKTG